MSVIKNRLLEIANAEKIEIDDLALTLIAKKADGALRDAQSLFDQIISFCGQKVESELLSQMLNLVDEEVYFKISDAILEKDFNSAFNITQKIYENGWNFIDFLNGLNEHFRNIMTVVIRKKVDLVETADVYKDKYLEYTDKFSEGDLLRILSFINKTLYEIKSSSNQRLKVEVALCQLIGLERSSTISELISKMNSGGSISETPKKQLADFGGSVSGNSKNVIANVSPAIKEEIKIPEVKTFVAPTAKDSGEFNNIINKWQNFVEQVRNDKHFFGSVLVNSNPVEFLNDRLRIEVEHPDDWDIIVDNKSYLDKATKEFFGKRIEFDNSGTKGTVKKSTVKNSAIQTNQPDDNPIVNAIITQLGGKEIKRSIE
jgi:DNA polymerase-3 subunit gamma/tau